MAKKYLKMPTQEAAEARQNLDLVEWRKSHLGVKYNELGVKYNEQTVRWAIPREMNDGSWAFEICPDAVYDESEVIVDYDETQFKDYIPFEGEL